MERHKVLAMMSELKLSGMRAAYDDNGLRNPVDLWLPGGGKFHRKTGRKISTPAEVLPCWRAGIEAEVLNPTIRDALWFGPYTGMRREEVLTLRWERVDMTEFTFRVDDTKTQHGIGEGRELVDRAPARTAPTHGPTRCVPRAAAGLHLACAARPGPRPESHR